MDGKAQQTGQSLPNMKVGRMKEKGKGRRKDFLTVQEGALLSTRVR